MADDDDETKLAGELFVTINHLDDDDGCRCPYGRVIFKKFIFKLTSFSFIMLILLLLHLVEASIMVVGC